MCQKDVGNQSDKQGREIACCFLVIINQRPLFLEFLNVISVVIISKNRQIEGEKSSGRILIVLELFFFFNTMYALKAGEDVDRNKHLLCCLIVFHLKTKKVIK